MNEEYTLQVIARIKNNLPDKFGIPRQSGLVSTLRSQIIFEPRYRTRDALRGIEGYSHLWLIWGFSENKRTSWSATVRPPRLGGNKRIGVFATRSPFRPNPVGLSCVRLDKVENTKDHGTILHISGADLMNNTPIFDIKPYLPFTDSHPDASGGFTIYTQNYHLDVQCDDTLMQKIPLKDRNTVIELLSQDPRPSYQNDPNRIYGMNFADINIRFKVQNNILTVIEII